MSGPWSGPGRPCPAPGLEGGIMAYDPFPAGGEEAYCPRCGQMVVTYEPGQGCTCFRDDDYVDEGRFEDQYPEADLSDQLDYPPEPPETYIV